MASSVLLVTLPIQVAVAVAVARKLGRPILFRQSRPGRNGKPFVLIKFRSMTTSATDDVSSDASRLTPFGRGLRSTSLDELPSLLNVIKGDMSMVGPRPLLMQYLRRYTPTQARRHEVRPGITGLAQAKGRNAIGWDEKFDLDTYYVDHRSALLDAKILVWTVIAVVKRDGITAADQATVGEFMGSTDTGSAA